MSGKIQTVTYRAHAGIHIIPCPVCLKAAKEYAKKSGKSQPVVESHFVMGLSLERLAEIRTRQFSNYHVEIFSHPSKCKHGPFRVELRA